jgi:hypothetical protein
MEIVKLFILFFTISNVIKPYFNSIFLEQMA